MLYDIIYKYIVISELAVGYEKKYLSNYCNAVIGDNPVFGS